MIPSQQTKTPSRQGAEAQRKDRSNQTLCVLAVYIAISRNTTTLPRLDYPPIRSFRFSGNAFAEGIERVKIDGFKIPVYRREKTIADTGENSEYVISDV